MLNPAVIARKRDHLAFDYNTEHNRSLFSHATHYYKYIYIYIFLSRVDGSVGQPKACKSEVPGTTPDISCFSLVFIKNLIKDKSKHKKKNVTICFVLSGAPHSYL